MIGFVKFNMFMGVVILLLSDCAYADTVCQSKSGKLVCGAGEVKGFNYLGDVVLNGTQVTSSMRVIGDLEMRHSNITEANVIGDLTATDSEIDGATDVKGDATLAAMQIKAPIRVVGDAKISDTQCFDEVNIIGDVNINNVYFAKKLTIVANEANFSHAQTHSITVDPTQKTQHLYLTNESTVDGDIEFLSGRGKVSISEGSKVLGRVVGGVVSQQ